MNIKTIGIILIAVLFLTGTGASIQEWQEAGPWKYIDDISIIDDISKKITEHQSVFDILKDKAPEGATIDDITFDLPPSFDKELVGTEATWIPEVGKTAYVFNDLSGWEHIITGPKRHHIANYFKDMGYTVFTVDATNKNFDSMLTDTNTGAIAYFGHGGEPAIGFRGVSTVQSQARVAKITKYRKQGLSFKDAKEKAESETIQFDYIYNHACYSMGSDDKKDTNVGDELLRPGGIYWGKQGLLRAYQPLQTYIKPK